MSAGYVATKADLVAIYRLEFYRKQKNWKLSPDKRKKAAPSKTEKISSTGSNTILNQTYNVETERPETEESPLNEAFVESGGSDKNIEPHDSPEDTSTKTSNPEPKPPSEQNLREDQKLPENWIENEKPNNWLQDQMFKQWTNLPPVKDSENQFWQVEECPERDNLPNMPKDCPRSEIWSQTPQAPENDTCSHMPKECTQSEIWRPINDCPENNIWPQMVKNGPPRDIWPETPKECIKSEIWHLAKDYPGPIRPQMPQERPQTLQPARECSENNLWSEMPKECPHSEIWQSKECRANNIWSNPEFGWTDASELDVERGWPATNIWSNIGYKLQGSARVDELQDHMDQEMYRESAKLVSAAEEWLQDPVCSQLVQDSADRVSQDSLSEFMRGAHCVPHSSELELRLPPADVSFSDRSLSQVTTTTLKARIRSHVCALRLLLREAASRDQLSLARNSLGCSGDSQPTRDVAPTDFVAGSFRNCAEADILEGGRGRGRLHTRVIAIGAGRPFRL